MNSLRLAVVGAALIGMGVAYILRAADAAELEGFAEGAASGFAAGMRVSEIEGARAAESEADS